MTHRNIKGRHISQECSQPVEQTSWPGSSMSDAIWAVSSVARPHICTSGCAHLSLRSASAPGIHSKGTALGMKVRGGERWLPACPEGRLLFGCHPWTSWNLWAWFPRPDLEYWKLTNKNLWCVWGLLSGFSGVLCMGRMRMEWWARGQGLYDIKGIWSFSRHTGNVCLTPRFSNPLSFS